MPVDRETALALAFGSTSPRQGAVTLPSPLTFRLKCEPPQFAAIARGDKKADFRRFDRVFVVGAHLQLQEWEPDPYAADGGSFTGRDLLARVTHLEVGGDFGIPSDHVILSIELVRGPLELPEVPA